MQGNGSTGSFHILIVMLDIKEIEWLVGLRDYVRNIAENSCQDKSLIRI